MAGGMGRRGDACVTPTNDVCVLYGQTGVSALSQGLGAHIGAPLRKKPRT